MKHKLTKHELLGSLAFPVVIMIWMAYEYISGSIRLADLGTHFGHRWSYIIAFTLCGVLPLLLTLILQIDTSDQFVPRLVISLCTLALVSIVKEFLGVGFGRVFSRQATCQAVGMADNFYRQSMSCAFDMLCNDNELP